MNRNTLWSLVFAVAFVLVTCLGATAEEGVTDTEIHIGQWGPQTGPAAPWGSVARGTDAYFKMINAEGGIHGRKLVHHMFDDAYNPAKTTAGVKELQEGTGMFAWVSGVGTAPGLAVRDYLMERKIPWIGPSSGSIHWIDPANRYLFPVYPLYYIEAKALVRYAAEELGLKRVAIAYQNDDYGKNGVLGAEKELITQGLKMVAKVPVEVKDTDMKPYVMQLRQANPDVVLLWVSPVHAVKFVGTGKAMKFTPQWMSTSTCSDFPLMMHISKGLWQGVIATTFGELPDSDLPLMKKYKTEAFDKFAAKGERWGVFFTAGFTYAEPLVEALKRVGPDLTREKLVTALEGLKGFRGSGGEITYSAFNPKDPYGSRQGMKTTYIIKCLADGKAEKLSGWIAPRYP